MSLDNSVSVKQFKVGIIAAKNLDDSCFIGELIGENLARISHLYTNGVNVLVTDFARDNGINYTVFPMCGGKNALLSNSQVIEVSDFVYIIASPDSKNSPLAQKECEKQGVKYKLVSFEPINYYREKVCKVAEIIAATTKEDVQNNAWMKAIDKVL